jgi:hypothetical protein
MVSRHVNPSRCPAAFSSRTTTEAALQPEHVNQLLPGRVCTQLCAPYGLVEARLRRLSRSLACGRRPSPEGSYKLLRGEQFRWGKRSAGTSVLNCFPRHCLGARSAGGKDEIGQVWMWHQGRLVSLPDCLARARICSTSKAKLTGFSKCAAKPAFNTSLLSFAPTNPVSAINGVRLA